MKWKKKIHSTKKFRGRKIASAVGVLGVLAVCLGVIGYRGNLKAGESHGEMTRGVVAYLDQIPQTKKALCEADADNYKATLGTKENPFFVLEIVPYKEYATFGYHISGCEPIDVSGFGKTTPLYFVQNNMKTGSFEKEEAFFFKEEPEANPENYDGTSGNPTEYHEHNGEGHDGYFELVEDGKGTFQQNQDGSIDTTHIVDNGNIIWHTLSKKEEEKLKQKDSSITFAKADDPKQMLTKVGDRIYTQRLNTAEDPIWWTTNYCSCYENKDDFLLNTMELTKEQADKYSIIVKTITPEELNKNPEWADYADLYLINRKKFLTGDDQTKIWKEYNKYGEQSSLSQNEQYKDDFINTDSNKNRDLKWEVVEKIFNRVTAEKNFAGLIMGNSLYKINTYTGSTKESKKIALYDWNLKKVYFPQELKEVKDDKDSTESTESSPKKEVEIDSGMRSNNNVYKLAIMLTSMDTRLFKKIYMDKNHPLIKNGEFELRDGDDKTYWSMKTFWLLETNDINVMYDPYNKYFKQDDMWENYGITTEMESADKFANIWVKGHLYGFNDDNSLTFEYGKGNANANKYLSDYQDYLNKYYDSESNHEGTPSDAVRYILGQRTKQDDQWGGTLNVLDIEPCYDSKNGYSLTENYISLMVPKFHGTVNITHMTTAEFIGKSEDLNSKYNLIFMGLDDGAYNKNTTEVKVQDTAQKKYYKVSEIGAATVWNDTEMNGKIYFHTGDKMTSAEYVNKKNNKGDGRNRSVKFLWVDKKNDTAGGDTEADGKVLEDATLRFPGNDITNIKIKELNDFLDAGRPIVAVSKLYNNDGIAIDQNSNVSKFIKTQSGTSNGFLYCADNFNAIQNAVKNTFPKVTFAENFPREYNGATETDSSVSVTNPNYLERNNKGRSVLEYKFTINDKNEYSYRIYIDQNQDAKFDQDEIYYSGKTVGKGEHTISLQLSKLYMGLVQWKIEVYQLSNEKVRYVKEGCSAAKNINGDKKQIKVLQIVPDMEDKDGFLNLQTDATFTKYYDKLDDYKITVTVMTADDFMNKFKGHKFSFDYSKDIDDTNPQQFTSEKYGTDVYNLWSNYNMYIIGFGDTYHKKNITNENGAVDFIKFFIASGKSVLFTHDLTSMHNINATDFGFAANTLLRDVMGMNRYEGISKNLSSEERTILKEYQKKLKYDTVVDINGNNLEQKQGFTYYAMKRLGWPQDNTNLRYPYQYMIKSATSDKYICGIGTAKETGFNNNNDITTTVSQTNEGQITEYPYKIRKNFTVSETHGQWYQLDMEDPEVTVWYCLSDDKKNPDFQSDDDSKAGTAATYGVSPNDVANNYYIYSKGNVFYSGVGHSKVSGDMEAKLFINTMIGAYRASYVPPVVEILNPEAEITDMDNLKYEMSFAQEYEKPEKNVSETQNKSDVVVDNEKEGMGSDDDQYIKVEFSPVELNAISTKLKCSISYDDSNQFLKYIYHVTDNKGHYEILEAKKVTNADGTEEWQFDDKINHMDEYYFYYPKAYLNSWKDKTGTSHSSLRNITFKINSDKVKISGYTKLNMSVQSLFMLD